MAPRGAAGARRRAVRRPDRRRRDRRGRARSWMPRAAGSGRPSSSSATSRPGRPGGRRGSSTAGCATSSSSTSGSSTRRSPSGRGCSGWRRTSCAWSRSCSRSTASRCSTRASTAAASSCTTCSGARRDGGFAKHLRPSSAIDYAPDLRRKGLTGAILYHDGVEDDARLALAVLRTALAGGAVAATRVRAPSPLLDGERIIGASVRGPRERESVRGPRRAGHRCDGRLGGRADDPIRDARGRRRVRPEPRLAHRDPARSTARRGRDDAAHPGSRRVHHPVAGPLDHRHDRPPRFAAPRARRGAA